jgi:uncharacterized protein YqeY
MSLSEKLSDDLKNALKSGNKEKLSVLRMIKAAMQNREIEKKASLTDEDIYRILQTHIRQRKDSIEQFSKGGRQDLVDKETRELSIIQSYLPLQLSEEELKEIIQDAVRETNANSMKDLGRVIKFVMEKVKGQVDGKLVNQLVKDVLTGDP